MKVKTNFKKMYLVDSLPINNEKDSGTNDNTFLNKFIETSDIEIPKPIANNNSVEIIDGGNKVDDDENNSKKISNKSHNNKPIEINEDSEEYNIVDENKDGNNPNLHNDNKELPICENTTKDFNFKKCLDDCFKKSSIKYDNNKKFSVINDDENGEVFKEGNDDDDDDNDNDDDEKELLNRLERIRSNKKILKNKRRKSLFDRPPKLKRLDRTRYIKRNPKTSILSKYKHKKYLPKQSLQSYMNNNVIRKEGRNLKRKSLSEEESFYESKREKIDLNTKAIPLINNESIESDSDMNLDYSDKSENDLESSMEDDDQIEFDDNTENEKPYSLRQTRKKPQKYQDYIMNDYVCRICDREFKNETALENHITTCKIYSFACTICGKNYKTKWGLQSHLSNMHSRKKNRNKFT